MHLDVLTPVREALRLAPAAAWLLDRFPELALAGGFPRDAVAGLEPSDADLVVVAEPGPELRLLLDHPDWWLPVVQYAAGATSNPAAADLAGHLPEVAEVRAVPGELLRSEPIATARAVTFRGPRFAPQIIRAQHAGIGAALASFDFRSCAIAVVPRGRRLPGDDELREAGLRRQVGDSLAAVAADGWAEDVAARRLVYTGPAGNDAAGSIRRALAFAGRGWRLEPRELQRMIAASLERAGAEEPGIAAEAIVASSGPATPSSAAAVREAMRAAEPAPEPDARPIPVPSSGLPLHPIDPAGELAYLDADGIAASAVADHSPATFDLAPEPFEAEPGEISFEDEIGEPEDLFGAGARIGLALCNLSSGPCPSALRLAEGLAGEIDPISDAWARSAEAKLDEAL